MDESSDAPAPANPPSRPVPRRTPARAVGRFGRRLLVGILVGGGTIFGAKAEREQHWSVPPTMLVEQHAEDADGEPDDGSRDGTGRARPGRLPACV